MELSHHPPVTQSEPSVGLRREEFILLGENQVICLLRLGSSTPHICERRLGPVILFKEQEKVQRRAARFVKNYKRRESGVTEIMRELKWESLERRGETSRLVIFYKSLHGETAALPLPYHLVRVNGNTRGHSERCVQVKAKTLC